MSYIGKTPTVGNFIKLDDISTSSTNSYTLQHNSVNFSPESANHMLVSLNGVIQAPNTAFSVSGSTITFLPSSGTLSSSDSIDFIMVYGNVLDVGVASTVSDASVTKAKMNLISDSSSAGLTIKGDGSSENGTIQMNCSQNSHGIKLSSPAHSAGQSYELIFPTGNVTADKFLKVASVSGSGATGVGQLSFADAGGITVASQWRVNNSPSGMNNNDIVGETDHGVWEQNDTQYSNIGSAMSQSSGIFTFPSTGIYLVSFKVSLYDATEQAYFGCNIDYTNNNSSYNDLAEAYTSLKLINSTTTYASTFAHSMLDVTDTSNVKVRFRVRAENGGFEINGSSSVNKTVATFIRLGDT